MIWISPPEARWDRETLYGRLAKKPPQCLEYLVVHELLHLIDRTHGDRFKALLDQHLPQWRLVRSELNRAPLGHVDWGL